MTEPKHDRPRIQLLHTCLRCPHFMQTCSRCRLDEPVYGVVQDLTVIPLWCPLLADDVAIVTDTEMEAMR